MDIIFFLFLLSVLLRACEKVVSVPPLSCSLSPWRDAEA
jgi:hypothetical protein